MNDFKNTKILVYTCVPLHMLFGRKGSMPERGLIALGIALIFGVTADTVTQALKEPS